MKHFAIHKLSKTQPSLLTKVSDRLCCGDGDSIVLHSYYTYDHAGERTLKLTGNNDIMDVNADEMMTVAMLNNLTMYPSPYLVLSDRGYTKHYYTGSERLCARIGGGNLATIDQVIIPDYDLSQKANELFEHCLNMNIERELSHDYNLECITGIDEDYEELRHWIDGIPIRLNSETQIDLQTFKDMMNHYTSVEESEDEVFFYHSDHLGSASWITNGSGTPIQHLQYMPYGEPFVNERTTAYEERFTFTGKERDSETGFSYFGARYYDSDLMTGWLSVDPLADKYPNISPYAYCNWNPVKIVDPNGEFGILAHSIMVKNALKNTNLNWNSKFKILWATGWTSDVKKENRENNEVHFDSQTDKVKNFQNIKDNFAKYKDSSSEKIKDGKFEEAGIDLHTVADFYAHSNYVELYLEYAKSSNTEITSEDAIPLFSDVYSNPENYSGFLEILNNKLTTGIYDSMMEDFFSRDPKSHKRMNHDSPFSNMGRKKYNGIKAYKFARSLAEREINTIINSLNQN